MNRILRRHLLQYAGMGAASLVGARYLVGCSDEGAALAADGGMDAGEWMAAAYDPDTAWWLQGNFAPVSQQSTAMDLEVLGTLPTELNGLYVRNGSNPMGLETGHWFLGDGMLHGVRLQDGKASWYRNRWVQTPLLGKGFGGVPGLEATTSNVSVVHHGGKLLSLGEVGLPIEISTDDLSTVGFHDYGGKLQTFMTAHPTIDPDNGDLLFFGYNFAEPYLTYHRADRSGALVQTEVIDVPGPTMMHSFAQTKQYVIFMDLPVVFDLDRAAAGESFPYTWSESYGARMGVMPKTGGSADVTWFDVDPCYIFHVMNAYEDGDTVNLEAVRYDKLWVTGSSDFDRPAHLHRFRLNMADGSVDETALDDRNVEFPQINQHLAGRNHRYGYTLHIGTPFAAGERAQIDGILKLDRDRDSSEILQFDAWRTPGEVFFVPAEGGSGEDDGYLLTFVYDAKRDASELLVLDARDIAGDPVAQVRLPFRVPIGFHGHWVDLGT